MGDNVKFNNSEKEMFNEMIRYYLESAKRELAELKGPGGNKEYIFKIEENINALVGIHDKTIETLF